MRLFVTGGSGVLGRSTIRLLMRKGHRIDAPLPDELDLFDPDAVARAVEDSDGVLHLATRIPHRALADDREAWRENDRLRADASRLLVDAALATTTQVYVQPSVSFIYPAGIVVDEETPLGAVPEHLRPALAAEGEAARFATRGRRGVVLRFGLLDGPGTGNESPSPRYGATLHVADAGHALAAALELPSGVYNVCRDGEHVSNERLKRSCRWRPEH